MTPDNRSLYSISDLADQVGVPRTTIADWLGKYARFIELRTQGRRRFYTERTLSVLCKIAELRTAGRSSVDIDGELERIFPVHPTVEPPDAPDAQDVSAAREVAGPAPDPAAPSSDANPGQTYPVVKQESADELYDLLGAKFADLCDAMSAVDRKADASARRLRMMFAVVVMIIVVLAGFLAIFYAYFLVQRDNTAASRDTAARLAELKAGSETRENALSSDVSGLSGKMSGMEERVSGIAGSVSGLSGDVSGLSGRVSGLNDELERLRADLPAQRAAFEAAVEELKKSSGSALEAQEAQFEARIALEKEQFAADRLKLLQQIDSLQERLNQAVAGEPARAEELRKLQNELADQIERGRDVEKLRAEMESLAGRVDELQKKNESLAGELDAANRRAADEAEARRKAEADAENARRAAARNEQNPPQSGDGRDGMR